MSAAETSIFQHAPAGTTRKAPRIAVLVPCYNEALSIRDVVCDFMRALPTATIYVYDNNSKDNTATLALESGAVVRTEREQGKGNVVRRMFSDVDADVYIMVDGDGTYDASISPRLVDEVCRDGHDFVNVARVAQTTKAYRPGHIVGNRMLTWLIGVVFGTRTSDMLSGYKAFSRRFVKTFLAVSKGFEIETELMIHALELRVPLTEISAPYIDRPAGSISKLNTFRDGFRILKLFAFFVKHDRPVLFFGSVAAILATVSIGLGIPVFAEFSRTGLVPRLPTAIAAASVMLASALSLVTGLVLDSLTHSRREFKRLAYLGIPGPDH